MYDNYSEHSTNILLTGRLSTGWSAVWLCCVCSMQCCAHLLTHFVSVDILCCKPHAICLQLHAVSQDYVWSYCKCVSAEERRQAESCAVSGCKGEKGQRGDTGPLGPQVG